MEKLFCILFFKYIQDVVSASGTIEVLSFRPRLLFTDWGQPALRYDVIAGGFFWLLLWGRQIECVGLDLPEYSRRITRYKNYWNVANTFVAKFIAFILSYLITSA